MVHKARLESSLEFRGREGAVRRESVQGRGCLRPVQTVGEQCSILRLRCCRI
jgi:hypothetical protein